MQQPKYLYKSEPELTYFEFISEGPKGRFKKIVEYSETSTRGVFNLAFGDFNETIGKINDFAVTNNGDSRKVLATVASTLYAFMEKHPGAWVVATGSTSVRTRLYRMGIANNLEEISKDFMVYGFSLDGIWEDFLIGEDYEAFLVTSKKN